MKWLATVVLLAMMLESIVAPPVIEKKEDKKEEEKDKNARFEDMGIEYNRYLVQVVEALESDPDFRKKLENATSEDIQSGDIAHELDFVSHNVRTKLDELKRIELDRLRKLARQEYELENDIDTKHMKIDPGHVDHTNPHTFEIADLKKLIAKTSEDLAEADKKRRDEFKTYEMEKEFEKNQKLKELDEDKRKKYLEELEQQKLKHKQHDPLHHPGSKQQLEEVWEKQDHMEQEFDPKAFFFMHDLDGNQVWDEAEVKALFLKELDKLYQAGAPEDDMRERAEEMERMREHVFREADLNHDNLISYQEFLAQTKKPEFERDPGWEPLDEQQIYTPDEYAEFERRRQQEIERLIREGKLQPPPMYHAPPPPNYYPPQGYHPNQVPYQQQPQAYQQQQLHQQQQQHYQQQQQTAYQQQQQYQQQNPPHYQQQQYQQQPIGNPQQQQPYQQQQQYINNQQPVVNSQQQPVMNNQQQPVMNNQQQPVMNNQQQPVVNNQQQPNLNNQQQQQPVMNNQQQPVINNQQQMSNNIPQQQPVVNSVPQQQQQQQQPPNVNNFQQQQVPNSNSQPVNIPQQPMGNSIPNQGNIPQPNAALNSNNIPKVASNSGPVLNSIPQGPK
ncbi:nucleobindin-2 isoform X2 [Macrosteles quadrilineatus]|uniref:nucleobindin-2 isoform X2 n=1 Tax=Macrosteles quadrilineatus TaxID=74068 RepID=UPI0023E0C3B9|nr:nucleobindin-2 isoform X2 [Macrosteles quadrilineatus]